MTPGLAHLEMAREAVDAQKAEHQGAVGSELAALANTLDIEQDTLEELALAHTGGDGVLAAFWLDGLAVGAAYRRSVEA